jgi:hypothetical protein
MSRGAVSAPPPEAMEGFRHLRALAAYWNGTWRYRPAGADLDAALTRAQAEVMSVLEQAGAAVDAARKVAAAARRDGPDILVAHVYGDSIPEMTGAALIEAAALWGEWAESEVEGVSDVQTNWRGARGRFEARVRVRCLNYAETGQTVPEAGS